MRETAIISRANHYFKIHGFYEQFVVNVIKPFCRIHLCKTAKRPVPGTRRQQWVVTHVFARSNPQKTEFRLPIELFKEFVEYAAYRGYNQSRFKIEEVPVIPGKKVHFEFNPGFENQRPGQHEWTDYMLEPGHLKINNASTGNGKTYMSIYTMVKTGELTIATMQPRYIFNFVKELYKVVKLEPGDILMWEQDLSVLHEVLKRGDYDPKIIIIPMSRIEVYLRHEKENRDQPSLETIIEAINPGLRIIDEGHEAIHQIFLSLLYGNIKKVVVLSATLKADDPFTNKVYKWLYPQRYRLKDAEPENYIDVVAYLYRMNLRKHKVKTEQFGGYNDKAFEESILKSEALTRFYFELTDKAFREYYLNRRREGTKCFFFFSRVNMCYAMLELFKKKYPDMDIETFTGDDSKKKESKDKYLRHEVIITTPNSCGTGKDMPGLITSICAHSVSSTQSNKQIIGRLRDTAKMFNGELPPIFVFTVCVDIDKQVEYLGKREVAFADKQKSFKRINSECSLD
ncbi:hypothetical protein D3C81_287460 [compost metagenome]